MNRLTPPAGSYGQLWEECEVCGREPVWMPHMLCARCWPRTRAEALHEPRHPSEIFDKNDEPKGTE